MPVLNASRAAILIALVAGSMRLVDAAQEPVWDITENMRVGLSLATTGEFANPFNEPTGPTAHVAPALPVLIAAGIKATGDTDAGYKVARYVGVVLFGVFLARLPAIARALGLAPATGVLAAFVIGFVGRPFFAWMEVKGEHEGLLTAVAFGFLVAATARTATSTSASVRGAAALGLAWGAGMYVSPVLLLPMLAVWFSFSLFQTHRRTVVRLSPVFLGAFALAVAPWMARNAIVLGAPAFIRDNYGLELAMSHAPDAEWRMAINFGEGRSLRRHPYRSTSAAIEMRTAGEINYYRLKKNEAIRWMAENPKTVAINTLKRTIFFFYPVWDVPRSPWFFVPLLLLWVAGSVLLFRDKPAVGLSLNAGLLAFGAPYFLIQANPRYQYPVLWIFVLVASHALVESWRWWQRRRLTVPST